MASKVAIGIMRSNAMNRCLDAIPKIAGKLGIPPVDIPTQGRDPDLLHAKQLEAQAEFYERVSEGINLQYEWGVGFSIEVDALSGQFAKVLGHLTVKQLEDLAKAEGVEPSGTKKEDLIHALIALPSPESDDPETVPDGDESDTPEDETADGEPSDDPETVDPVED